MLGRYYAQIYYNYRYQRTATLWEGRYNEATQYVADLGEDMQATGVFVISTIAVTAIKPVTELTAFS